MANTTNLVSGDFPNPATGEAPGHAQTEEQRKLAALGARVASAFSDALTVINGHAALLMEREGLSPEIVRHTAAIYHTGERAAHLARQLLIIGGAGAMNFQAVDLHRLINQMVPPLRRLLGATRPLALTLSAQPAVVWADIEMLEQVLLSLATNARDAMPLGGQLSIATETLAITEADVALHPAGRTGDFACLAVRDTGCGMSHEILTRIFEPLFTTKKNSPATGRGLAAVLAIVEKSQGWLTVESQPGAGTMLQIFLPLAPAGTVAEFVPGDGTDVPGGKETILLVDDDPSLRDLTAMVLQHYGYRVLQAGDSAEALEVWQWHAPRIALLFTDLVMPGNLTGLELAAKLQAEKPSLKIICISGNADKITSKNFPALTEIRFLQKPCSPQAVGLAVRALLDRKNT